MSYGQPIGIITLEENIPCPPGTPGNPTTFSHPVCYEVVRGISTASLADPDNPGGLQEFIAAGQALAEKGVCAIAGNCGLMIVHQEQLASAVAVPVFLSSLLQLPFIARTLGAGAAVGIIASSRAGLKAGHVRMAAAGADIATATATMDGKQHFRAASWISSKLRRKWSRWPGHSSIRTAQSRRSCSSVWTCRPMPARCSTPWDFPCSM